MFQKGNTYYTLGFLLPTASQFIACPQSHLLQEQLVHRWTAYVLGASLRGSWSLLTNVDDNSGDGDVPWMLGALRCTDVLMDFVYLFCSIFLHDLCEEVEEEAWLADSRIFSADVCYKLAKPVMQFASISVAN